MKSDTDHNRELKLEIKDRYAAIRDEHKPATEYLHSWQRSRARALSSDPKAALTKPFAEMRRSSVTI